MCNPESRVNLPEKRSNKLQPFRDLEETAELNN